MSSSLKKAPEPAATQVSAPAQPLQKQQTNRKPKLNLGFKYDAKKYEDKTFIPEKGAQTKTLNLNQLVVDIK